MTVLHCLTQIELEQVLSFNILEYHLMKSLLTFLVLAFVSVSITNVHAAETAEEAQTVVEKTWKEVGSFTPGVDCAGFSCPISGVTTVQQCFEVPDCPNVTDAQLKAAVNRVVDKFCTEFKRCCVANGCDEGRCRLVSFTYFCASQIRLCVSVTIEYKCE